MSEVVITARNAKGELVPQTIELVLPRSLWIREAVYIALGESHNAQMRVQVGAAALFLCWPGSEGKRDAPRYQHDVQLFGAQVLEYLLTHGSKKAEIFGAATQALDLIEKSLPTEEQHDEALGNSEAPSGASSASSSPSAASTGQPSSTP